jgi:hypothetical protein
MGDTEGLEITDTRNAVDLGARQEIHIRSDYPIVIPAGFWRESRNERWNGFPPKACGNDGVVSANHDCW